MRALREGGAWRRKRHGAPNREPPEIRSAQIAEPLCPVRGDDLPAGVVRISGPAPRPASLGMRSVRLQVRDPGHVPRPIVGIFRAPPTLRETPREEPPAVSGGSAFGSWALGVTKRPRSVEPRSRHKLSLGAAADGDSGHPFRWRTPAIRARAKAREPVAPPPPRSQDARRPATAAPSHVGPRTGA
jgi:hypothetical protein